MVASLQYGGTLRGTIVTNNAFTVVCYDIIASSGPGFPGFTFPGFEYTQTSSTITDETSTLIQFDSPGSSDELRLNLASALTTSGAALRTSSYESESAAGNRKVTAGAIVPEPASILLTTMTLAIAPGVARVGRKQGASGQSRGEA